MKDFDTLPFTPAPTMVGIFKYANNFGWKDFTSHYGDPDCNLTQRFVKDEITLDITWLGNGRFEQIVALKVEIGVGEDNMLFFDYLSTPEALVAKAQDLFAKNDYYPGFDR